MKKELSLQGISFLRLLIHTQPKLTGFKKTPEFLELGLGGTLQEQETFAKEHLGKEIAITDSFTTGTLVDIHGVTKGKGFQGPVKRFGVHIRHHKSEKTKRGPGTLGPWSGDRSWTVAHAGQMGYHLRTENNKLLLSTQQGAKITPAGGFLHYGQPKTTCVIIKGSVQGPAKRLVTLTTASRTGTQTGTGVTFSHVA